MSDYPPPRQATPQTTLEALSRERDELLRKTEQFKKRISAIAYLSRNRHTTRIALRDRLAEIDEAKGGTT